MEDLSARIAQLRLRDLLLLEQIAVQGSLRKIAERLHVTQPAVTQALQSIERAFGVQLVERGPFGVRLTEAGEAAAARLRAARSELVAAAQAALAPRAPVLRIGSSPTAALQVLPAGIAALRRSEPQVKVIVVEGSVPQLWDALADGSLDALLAPLPGVGREVTLPEGLTSHAVGSERLVLVAPQSHPVARRRPDIAALARHEWVLPPAGSLAAAMLDEWFAGAGMQPPAAGVRSVSFFTNLRLAASCGLLTVVPEAAAKSHAVVLKLKVIATPWQHQRGEILFACRTSALGLPALQALRRSFPGLKDG